MIHKLKKLIAFGLLLGSFSAVSQTTLNTPVTTSRTVQDPVSVFLQPGFEAYSNAGVEFEAKIGTSSNPSPNIEMCEEFGKVLISEIYFDTRYNEILESRYHYYGEYIELYNSSTTPIDLTGWVIKDNHTQCRLSMNSHNSDLIIAPGGYKLITYSGFYAFRMPFYPQGYLDQGATSAIGTAAKFIEMFPELNNRPNFTMNDIIGQDTMILRNEGDKVTLIAPTDKVVDQVVYVQNADGLWVGPTATELTKVSSTIIDNGNGSAFNGAIGAIPQVDHTGSPVLDTNGNPVTVQHDEYKQAIYRSNPIGYYANRQFQFAVATASPAASPQVNVSLSPLDIYMTTDPNSNGTNSAEIIGYDIRSGSVIGQSKTYFNDLGKPVVSITKDFQNKLTWGTETVYDSFGRNWKESFPTTSCLGWDKIHFLTNPDAKVSMLDKYYNDLNTIEPYQANAKFPYSELNYDKLNPGNVINQIGGNLIDGKWRTGYSYTMPAAQEMYYAFGYGYFDGLVANGKEEALQSFTKTVAVDANGVENVAFKDALGRDIAAARSGGPVSYPVYSVIGTQGYVDVHIPAGTPNGTLLGGDITKYKVFDLKTGQQVTLTAANPGLLPGNVYRVEAKTKPTTDPKIYIGQTPTGGAISYDNGALGVSYSVNYYDYTINVFNKTGQLVKNVQPKGYEFNAVIKDKPLHLQPATTAFISTYTYNDQGQLKEVSSPDEGTFRFAYRNDGQMRYSQNADQVDTKVAYTNYDEYARPVESGVLVQSGGTGIWGPASANTDGPLLSGAGISRSEQVITVYDHPTNYDSSIATGDQIPVGLQLNALVGASYKQENLAGNVVVTYSKSGPVFNAITWYNYDAYGRVVWLVQYNEGLGAKTIHYEYDYKGNVTRVILQNDVPAEKFAHLYTYNSIDNALIRVETVKGTEKSVTHAEYSYYATGELKRANIAQGAQGLDYVYTLGGQLKSINHPNLTQADDPGHDVNDVFGLILDYHNEDYVRANTNIASSPTIAGVNQDFNGNIKAARWGNNNLIGNTDKAAYMYNYNRNGWMQSAAYGSFDTAGAITANTKFAEGNLNYDANGNITSLQRTNDAGTLIDDLSYFYNGNNQLNRVEDNVDPGVNYDIDSQSKGNYVYNTIGRLTKNTNEGLTYVYNSQGLTTEVNLHGQTRVKFFYNERGQRVKKESYTAGNLQSTTYYALDLSGNTIAVYSKVGANSITQNEMPIYGLSRLGVYTRSTTAGTDYMNYQITDHLGNVRAIVKKPVGSPIAAIFTADYYPFGEKLPSKDNVTGVYRYAYQGQELDGETGMEAFQLRLWDGRIGRWLNPDPKGQYASPYLGMGNNPGNSVDPDGGWESKFWRDVFWGLGGFRGERVEHLDSENPKNNYGISYIKDGGYITWAYTNKQFFSVNSIPHYEGKELGTPVFIIPQISGGITLPNPLAKDGAIIFAKNNSKFLVQHERGHAEQIRELGAAEYMAEIGGPSFYNGAENAFEDLIYGKETFSIPHEEYYTEVDANIKAFWLYGGNFKHTERNDKKNIAPSNPLVGRVTNTSVLDRIYLYYVTLHH
ncbi:lamin tail domain-containing protein [Flavobacterium amniphilum]|uniref:lamin tail domain-containing protein n=1 Tax=Flavobacterium amniphilum TaxID=1834035 RepID=UPI00202A63BF|nr:lamin tail domain-containing protein [Flavobacterium amniphilum]MCL9807185.1 lamin tail domain-containing protein [Flavobacterium amniphilum]